MKGYKWTALIRKPMTDLVYIAVIMLFFVISGLYARFCAKL